MSLTFVVIGDIVFVTNVLNTADRESIGGVVRCASGYCGAFHCSSYYYNFQHTTVKLLHLYDFDKFMKSPMTINDASGVIFCGSSTKREEIKSIHTQISTKSSIKLPFFVIEDGKMEHAWCASDLSIINCYGLDGHSIEYIFDKIIANSQTAFKKYISDNLQKERDAKNEIEKQEMECKGQLSAQFDEFSNAAKMNEKGILLSIKNIFELIEANPQNFECHYTIPTSDSHYDGVIKEIFSQKGYMCKCKHDDNNLVITVNW